MNCLWPRGPAESLHSFCNGAAADHNHFAPVFNQHSQLLAPLANGLGIQSAALIGYKTGAHFHHDAFGIGKYSGLLLCFHGGARSVYISVLDLLRNRCGRKLL